MTARTSPSVEPRSHPTSVGWDGSVASGALVRPYFASAQKERQFLRKNPCPSPLIRSTAGPDPQLSDAPDCRRGTERQPWSTTRTPGPGAGLSTFVIDALLRLLLLAWGPPPRATRSPRRASVYLHGERMRRSEILTHLPSRLQTVLRPSYRTRSAGCCRQDRQHYRHRHHRHHCHQAAVAVMALPDNSLIEPW
jgi:hypothetical protein